MAELSSMRNIGKVIEKNLKSVGICSAEELTRLGSKKSFLRLRSRDPGACLVLLYSLQGAIDNIDYNRLPQKTKQDLKSFSAGLK